jgi:hypothetical protein
MLQLQIHSSFESQYVAAGRGCLLSCVPGLAVTFPQVCDSAFGGPMYTETPATLFPYAQVLRSDEIVQLVRLDGLEGSNKAFHQRTLPRTLPDILYNVSSYPCRQKGIGSKHPETLTVHDEIAPSNNRSRKTRLTTHSSSAAMAPSASTSSFFGWNPSCDSHGVDSSLEHGNVPLVRSYLALHPFLQLSL